MDKRKTVILRLEYRIDQLLHFHHCITDTSLSPLIGTQKQRIHSNTLSINTWTCNPLTSSLKRNSLAVIGVRPSARPSWVFKLVRRTPCYSKFASRSSLPQDSSLSPHRDHGPCTTRSYVHFPTIWCSCHTRFMQPDHEAKLCCPPRSISQAHILHAI